MKKINLIFLPLMVMLCLTNCSVFRKKNKVADCTEERVMTSEISNVLIETKGMNSVSIYGKVTENGKPVTGGQIFFTGETSANEFITENFSISLLPGVYKVRIDGDAYVSYELGNLEFKPGEVRKIDFDLKGRTVFVERTTVKSKK